MKYINTFEKYFEKLNIDNDDNEQTTSLKTSINDIEQTINFYKSNKSKLDTIYDKYVDNLDLVRKLISSGIIDKNKEGISYTNELLSIYSSIPRNKRKIKDTLESINNINTDISELNSNSDMDQKDKQEKISELKKDISDKNSTINDIKKDIIDSEKKMKEKLKEMEEDIKTKLNKLKNNF